MNISRRQLLVGSAVTAALVRSPISKALYVPSGSHSGRATWQLASGHYLPHYLPLQIIAPRSSRPINNRYYKQYPGIAMRLPVSVLGGSWPFKYTLTGAPTGMSIGQLYGDANYGVITWSNPTIGTYSLTLTVEDQESNTDSVSWTLTVSTANTIFVDPVNGKASVANGGKGDGSIGNPFLTINDWYAGATGGTGSSTFNDQTYRDYQVYYRGSSNVASPNVVSMGGTYNGNMFYKPAIHMAYPGEYVKLDPETHQSHWTWQARPDCYKSDLIIGGAPIRNALFGHNGPASDIVYYNMTFERPSAAGVNGSNPDLIMFSNAHPSLTTHASILDCDFQGSNNHPLIESYYAQYCVVAGCSMENNDLTGFYLKLGTNDSWSFRNCSGLTGNTGRGCICLDNYTGCTNIEVTWCNFASTGSGMYYGPDGGGAGIIGVFCGRNTWRVGAHSINWVPLSNLQVVNDVVQFTNSGADSHGYHIIHPGSNTSPRYSGEECVGHNGSYVDSDGNLISSHKFFLGVRGHQVS